MVRKYFFAIIVMSLLTGYYATADGASRQYNILLVSIDTLRADHLSVYGYPRHTSPTLDKLCKKGVVFQYPIVQCSWTLPSHMSIFTSLYPSAHGVETDGTKLPEENETLGEMLNKRGYKTGAVVSSAYVGAAFGFKRGFDDFEKIAKPLEQGTEKITQFGLDWLDKNASDEPFLLFLHYLDPHTPYDPPAPLSEIYDPDYTGTMTGWPKDFHKYFRRNVDFENPEDLEHLIALYDGEIRRVDASFGKIIQKLIEKGVFDRTMIIIFSDHGEEFKEHGGMDHGRTLYEEQVLVPLIISLPDYVKEVNMVVPDMVQTIDIPPTILEICDFQLNPELQGKSLKPLMKPTLIQKLTYTHSEKAYAETFRMRDPIKMVQDDKYKFIYEPKYETRSLLFDMKEDPQEQKNLYKTHPDERKRLYEDMGNYIAENYMLRGQTQPAELSLEEIEQLQAIGYAFAGVEQMSREKLNGPGSLLTGDDEMLYVADYNNHMVKIMTRDGEVQKILGKGFSVDEDGVDLRQPEGITMDSNRCLYVSNSAVNQVFKLSPDLKSYANVVKAIDYPLISPAGLTVDRNDNLYICSAGNSRILKFNPDGDFLTAFSKPGEKTGELRWPTSIALDNKGNMFVVDLGNTRIQQFSPDGEYVRYWRVPYWPQRIRRGQKRYHPHIAYSEKTDTFYITDPYRGNILALDPYDERRTSVRPVRLTEELSRPIGIAVTGDGQELVVSDYFLNKITFFDLEKIDPLAFRSMEKRKQKEEAEKEKARKRKEKEKEKEKQEKSEQETRETEKKEEQQKPDITTTSREADLND